MDDDEIGRLRHDLRSPLTAISGFARLLGADGPLSEEDRREFAERIQAACEEIGRRIDELGAER